MQVQKGVTFALLVLWVQVNRGAERLRAQLPSRLAAKTCTKFPRECSTSVNLQPASYRSVHGCCISPARTLVQVPLPLKSLSPSSHGGDSWRWTRLCSGHAPNLLPFVPTHPLPLSRAASPWQMTPQKGIFRWKGTRTVGQGALPRLQRGTAEGSY